MKPTEKLVCYHLYKLKKLIRALSYRYIERTALYSYIIFVMGDAFVMLVLNIHIEFVFVFTNL